MNGAIPVISIQTRNISIQIKIIIINSADMQGGSF